MRNCLRSIWASENLRLGAEADKAHRAPRANAAQGVLSGGDSSGRLKCHCRSTSVGQTSDRVWNIRVPGVHDEVGAERLGSRQPTIVDVERDHARTMRLGEECCGEANRSLAEDRDRVSARQPHALEGSPSGAGTT